MVGYFQVTCRGEGILVTVPSSEPLVCPGSPTALEQRTRSHPHLSVNTDYISFSSLSEIRCETIQPYKAVLLLY